MATLGLVDDLLDLAHVFKLVLPAVASLPLLLVYYIGHNVTHVRIPVVDRVVDLGGWYYVYMLLFAVMCVNR